MTKMLFVLALCPSFLAQGKPVSSRSPASMYKVTTAVLDLEMSPSWTTYKEGDVESTKKGMETSLTGLYKIPDLPLQLGVNAFHEKSKADHNLTMTLGLGFLLSDEIALGWEIAPKFELEGAKKVSMNSAIGVIFHRGPLEWGFGYQEEIRDPNTESAPSFSKAAKMVGTHLKHKITSDVSGQIEYQMSFPQASATKRSSGFQVKTKVAYECLEGYHLKGAIGYTEATYPDLSDLNARNVPKMTYEIGADMAVTDHFFIAGSVELAHGSDEYQNVVYSRTTWTPTVNLTWLQ